MREDRLDYRLFFEESPDALLVLLPDSPHFTAVAANKAGLHLMRSTAEQIVGRGGLALFPGNIGRLHASLERVVATREPHAMAVEKCEMPRPDGTLEIRYWSLRNIPVRSSSGEVTHILHRAADVTGAGSGIGSGENSDFDPLSPSVVHDLRGPLRSIDGFSELLLQEHGEQLNQEGRRQLTIVRSSARRLSQLIDALVQFSRISRGDVRRISFDLSSVVRTVASQVQGQGSRASAKLLIAPDVRVHADPHLLQIVMENLLGNALKFSSKRADAEIEFGCQEADGEPCYYVRDNGAGFNMDYASKLFGVFQRLHAESEFPGTGIGLATVQRIVDRHGGRIWAVGEAAKGATFYFTLGQAPVGVLPVAATA